MQPHNFRKYHFFRLWRDTGFDPSKKMECLREADYPASASGYMTKSVNKIICRQMDLTKGLKLRDIVQKHADLIDAHKDGQPENPVQLKALELAYKMRDAIPNPRLQIQTEKTENVNISIETLQAAEVATGEKIIDLIPEEDWSEEPLLTEGEPGGEEAEIDSSL